MKIIFYIIALAAYKDFQPFRELNMLNARNHSGAKRWYCYALNILNSFLFFAFQLRSFFICCVRLLSFHLPLVLVYFFSLYNSTMYHLVYTLLHFGRDQYTQKITFMFFCCFSVICNALCESNFIFCVICDALHFILLAKRCSRSAICAI